MRCRVRYGMWIVVFLAVFSGFLHGGQRRQAVAEVETSQGIADLRAHQQFFYPTGGRDPLVMRLPTDREMGAQEVVQRSDAPTRNEMAFQLSQWLAGLNSAIKTQNYDQALHVGRTAVEAIDNLWPPIKADDVDCLVKSSEIRKLTEAAARLKNQQQIGVEFAALGLKVDGISWSHMDSKAMVNGKAHTAGEVLLSLRSQGDLRLETIEERGVVFRFQGMRFRIPISVYN